MVEVREVAIPTPGRDEVQIGTMFSGISAGTEMNVYRGRAPQWELRRDPSTKLFARAAVPEWSYPLPYGYANVGRVLAVGDDVSSPSVGDVVFSYTPHQSVVVVAAVGTIPVPKGIDPKHGVLNANLNTALNGVLDARPSLGDVVVISGLGVIGLLVTQLARRAGAGLVVGVDRIDSRRALAMGSGAHIVIDPGERVAEQVRALTNNRGADVVIEVSGAPAALNEAIRTVGFGGRVVAMSCRGCQPRPRPALGHIPASAARNRAADPTGPGAALHARISHKQSSRGLCGGRPWRGRPGPVRFHIRHVTLTKRAA